MDIVFKRTARPADVSWAGRRLGLGSMALAGLLQPQRAGAARRRSPARSRPYRGAVNPLHFAPKAKRVIFLCMAGGPSHLELFDDKPKLAEMHGQPMPESFTKGQPIAQLQGQKLLCFGPQYKFSKYGKSGQEISELLAAHRQRSPTTSASSARCRPSRSTTTRPTRS